MNLDYQNVNSLGSCRHYTSTARARSVFLSVLYNNPSYSRILIASRL